jgi:23S rRNA (adenine2503-C2)-methyltransferase
MNVVNIKDLSPKELENFIINLGEKPYRAVQLAKWIYKRGVTSFDKMTDLPKGLRASLGAMAKISSLKLTLERVSSDGAKKYVFELFDGNRIESVLIPDNGRATLCISTQVGCALGCTFCLTGRIGRIRNLSTSEILDQYLEVNNLNNQPITNIVFMGMGEPLDNLESTVRALQTLTNPDFIGFSPKRITVSTSGIVPKLKELAEQVSVNLSISLNAARDDLRNEIMPINKRYPIKELIEEGERFPVPKRKTLTFEYVLIKNVNDSDEDARKLGELLMGVKCKVNLIPFNEAGPLPYESPSDGRVFGFQKVLISYGINVRVRKNRGRDILGACGQLAADYSLKDRKTAKFSG